MKRLLPVALLTALMVVPAVSQARGPQRDDRRDNRHAVKRDDRRGDVRRASAQRASYREFQDARRDLVQLERLRNEYERAVRIRDLRSVRRIDQQVLRIATVELRDTERQAALERRRRDYRDARREQSKARLVRDVLQDYRRLQGRVDRRSLDMKRGMIQELVDMARFELRHG
ncbi:MAG TPA: hypothetical protein VK013_16065 [Myxococcaceae bacterium]|nr:hypothetical protein [Myxococcaceae bacterium]